ncbi:hypothetical protein BUALT_Bualt05G0098200 [Buddleja alternifolia]|uniref:Reverse transcriptase zinc-binding domain-containing protein n=1 Tax=Buddleja alternifolia TaxID=168488 RepID=A0AAV6XJI6_9LAMI|nr:hypothetical protein BUALT_Bualt05G0098200 [Buddleja alternifolia]
MSEMENDGRNPTKGRKQPPIQVDARQRRRREATKQTRASGLDTRGLCVHANRNRRNTLQQPAPVTGGWKWRRRGPDAIDTRQQSNGGCLFLKAGFTGYKFTWNNKRDGLANIQQRLDRGLVNPTWTVSFPHSLICHLLPIASDHSPLLLLTDPVFTTGPKPFRFEEMWLQEESVQDPSRDNLALLEAVEVDLDESYKKLETFWHQKSRLKWLRDGDANTKFFHLSSILHRRNNKICEVTTSTGILVGSRRGISWLHPVCWETVCSPKSVGGLGLRKMEHINQALISKLAWNMAANSPKIWVKMLSAKYLVNNNFFNSSSVAHNSSWTWQDICKVSNLIKASACFVVTHNSHINTWSDPWIPDIAGFIPSRPSLVSSAFDLVHSLIDPITKHWSFDILSTIFPPSTIRAILKIRISSSSEQSNLVWTPTSSGKFSVKSAYASVISYKFQSPHPSHNNLNTIYSLLWKAKIHDRFKVFIWRLLHKSLPTREILGRFIALETNVCPFCHGETESDFHLFLECPFVRQIWWESKWNFRPLSLNISSLEAWFVLILDPNNLLFQSVSNREEFLQYSLCFMDLIWKARNSLIHDNEHLQVTTFLKQVSKMAKDHSLAQSEKRVESKLTFSNSAWKKPPHHWIKVNCHSYFQNDSAWLAWIFFDSTGSIIDAFAFPKTSNSPAQAAIEVLLAAMKVADSHQMCRVIFESDCVIAVKMLLGPVDAVNWDCKALISQANQILSRRPFWNICPIRVSSNAMAQALAFWAHHANWSGSVDLNLNFINVIFAFISQYQRLDVL